MSVNPNKKTYWEVLYWRKSFDPGTDLVDDLSFNHGDLNRRSFLGGGEER